MSLQLITEPSQLAVSISDAKKQVEIGESDLSHDSHVTRLISSAIRDVERHTRRALINQTWRISRQQFVQRIYLPRPPLQSVTSIKYIDINGTLQTLSGSLYQISDGAKPGFVEPVYGQAWPAIRSETIEPVSITYVAGFGTSSTDVPAEFQNVILELVAFRFFSRGDVDVAIPKHIMWALDSLKCGAKYDYYGIKS